MLFSAIFRFVLNFHDFSMFSVSRKTCHSILNHYDPSAACVGLCNFPGK